MNLIAFEFSVFSSRGEANRLAVGIDDFGDFESFAKRMSKKLSHHQHNVLVRMIIVVPQDNIVSRLLFRPLVFASR